MDGDPRTFRFTRCPGPFQSVPFLLQLQHDSVQKCFAEMDFALANQCAGTSFTTPAHLDAYLKELETQMIVEQPDGARH